jgi:hypothetical protein
VAVRAAELLSADVCCRCSQHTTRARAHTHTHTHTHTLAPTNQVKPKFYEAFRGDGYAEAFRYRQRVIVLFQKIDGVDVALYCMYVQEYGADCAPPNRNVVYLSYMAW